MSRLYRNAWLASLPSIVLSAVCKKSAYGDDAAKPAAPQPDEAKKSPDAIAVYLNEESIRYLKVKLKKMGYGGYNGNMVVIKSDANRIDNYIFEPLFGDRVAFRIKGIVEITNDQEGGDDGSISEPHKLVACTGRLSSIAGEIKDDDGYLPSLPLYHDKHVVVDLDINPDPDHPFHAFNYKVPLYRSPIS